MYPCYSSESSRIGLSSQRAFREAVAWVCKGTVALEQGYLAALVVKNRSNFEHSSALPSSHFSQLCRDLAEISDPFLSIGFLWAKDPNLNIPHVVFKLKLLV